MARLTVGARVADRYLLLEELGGGGMGVVYRARDEQEAREVAIKVLRSAAGWDVTRRLRREARATNAIDPRRVARVYEVGETPDGELYLVMEYVRGETLRALMRKGRVSRREGLRILREVATALGEAHRAGIIHRDVKPDNILVGDEGRVVVVDFGIVKNVAPESEAAHVSTQLTGEGAILGTPAYLAPEQALGYEVGPEADEFALAVTAFELLTGSLPWRGTDVTGVLAQVLSETPPPASRVDETLPPTFDAVFFRALSKEKQARFAKIEDFVDALEAAERGESTSPLSQTVSAPLSARAAPGEAQTDPARTPRRAAALRRWGAAITLLALVTTATGLFARARSRGAAVQTRTDASPGAILAGPDVRVACPVFEVNGVAEVAGPLGAAAASLACDRAKWYLGGRDDRVLPAGSLLDVPTRPVEGFADPYAAPDVRERTVRLARARGTAYLDGTVTQGADGWLIVVRIQTPDGREIARAEGRDPASLPPAVRQAITRLWGGPALAPRDIDPEVARWTSFPDREIGLAATDFLQLHDLSEPCATLHRRASQLGNVFYRYAPGCGDNAGDAGAPILDESSPAALVVSVRALVEWGVPIAKEEARRIATKLDDARERETSRFARGLLADTAGRLWATVNEPDRAHEALLAAIREDPLLLEAWQELVFTSSEVGSTSSVSDVAAAWFPTEALFLRRIKSVRGDELPARLRETGLAYILEPSFEHAAERGRALAEAGRAGEARAVAAVSVGSKPVDERLQAYVLAFIDLHEARLARGLSRLQGFVGLGNNELVVVAGVLGILRDVATDRAKSFLAAPEDRASSMVVGRVSSIALCMNAQREVARRCLDRVTTLAHAARNWWDIGGEDFLEGARRYASGDVTGAVVAWRPLVAGPSLDIVRLLPTEAFERAGEPDLAARLDARKMSVTFLAGVSDAAPREAKRAFAAGDRARARELAQKVVAAWEVADATIPAVAEMRALLAALDR